ncbi:MAG: rRNA maturation RNase YbeY [Beijerinckiaceae bacterium]
MTTASDELNIEVAIECAYWKDFAELREVIGRALRQTLVATGVQLCSGAEVSVLLCDDDFIADLNRKWRNQDAPTNVLSFPAGGELALTSILGDIIIAFETTAREAATENKSFLDHFTHLVVHGFLHILGYDHGTDAEAEEMEALEREVLISLGIDDPYRGSLVESDGAL